MILKGVQGSIQSLHKPASLFVVGFAGRGDFADAAHLVAQCLHRQNSRRIPAIRYGYQEGSTDAPTAGAGKRRNLIKTEQEKVGLWEACKRRNAPNEAGRSMASRQAERYTRAYKDHANDRPASGAIHEKKKARYTEA